MRRCFTLKKQISKDKFKKTLYSVTALLLCAAALFSFWMTNKDNNKVSPEASDTEVFSEQNTDDEQVNSPVTDIPDDRENTEPPETAPLQEKYFSVPLENGISKGYSDGEIVKNATTDDWRTHNGVDLKGVVGDPVKSINNGVVKEVYDDALWGTVVVVDHYNGLTAEYRGLGRGSTADIGQTLKTNDRIGNLGEVPIEKADGAHLHLEIYKNGKAVSPTDYLDKIIEE